MALQFNAFISYKHAPADNKVAETIEKGLERFHIPKKIQQKTGIKRINKIFRDKDELPITSNLDDQISYALDHSEYLIVICSSSTKLSTWVPREIEYFLRRHDRNHVLTVLVDGEPKDVIPDILLHDTRTYYDHNGVLQTIHVDLEPLSCDFRTSLRKAKKEEIPRLASALLGCSYDELMNRSRQYKVRRMTFVFAMALALMLAFAGYMGYSRTRIQKSYNEALKNHSRYLANEAYNLLENEQRITALQLAIAALPKDKNDKRPVTPQAVRALTDATLSYKTKDTGSVYAAWNYTMANGISDFKVSEDNGTIACLDEIGNVCAWNTHTHEKVLTTESGHNVASNIAFADNKTLIVNYTDSLAAYNTSDGSSIWKIDGENYVGSELAVSPDSSKVFLFTANEINIIDPAKGDILDTIKLKDPDDFTAPIYGNFVVSPDGTKLAFDKTADFVNYNVGILDLSSKEEIVTKESTSNNITTLYWLDNDTLLCSYSLNGLNASGIYSNMSYLSTDRSQIVSYKASDLSEMWTQDFECSEVAINSGFFPLKDNKQFVYSSGNIATIYTSSTGEIVRSYNVNDSIIDTSDTNEDGIPVFVTREGGIAYPANDDNSLVLLDSLTDNLNQAVMNGNIYVKQSRGSEVICYSTDIMDDEFKEIESNTTYRSTISDSFANDRIVAFISLDKDDHRLLTTINPKDAPDVSDIQIEDAIASDYKILGTKEDHLYIASGADSKLNLLDVDLNSKNVETTEFVKSTFGHVDKMCRMNDGMIAYYNDENSSDLKVVLYNVETKEKKEYSLPGNDKIQIISGLDFSNPDYVTVSAEKEYVLNTKTGEFKTFSHTDAWGETTYMNVSSDGKLFGFTNGEVLQVMNNNGESLMQIACAGAKPIGLTFCKGKKKRDPEQLVVAYDNGTIYRYNSKNGNFLGKSDMSSYQSNNDDAEFDFDYDNNTMYLKMGEIVDVFELDSWYETACVQNCFGIHRPSDRFFVYSSGGAGKINLGYFKHYTIQDLVKKGEDILKGAELSEELKYKYGISDE